MNEIVFSRLARNAAGGASRAHRSSRSDRSHPGLRLLVVESDGQPPPGCDSERTTIRPTAPACGYAYPSIVEHSALPNPVPSQLRTAATRYLSERNNDGGAPGARCDLDIAAREFIRRNPFNPTTFAKCSAYCAAVGRSHVRARECHAISRITASDYMH